MPFFSRRKKADDAPPSPAAATSPSAYAGGGGDDIIEGLEDISAVLGTEIVGNPPNARGAGVGVGSSSLSSPFPAGVSRTLDTSSSSPYHVSSSTNGPHMGSSTDEPPMVPQAPPTPRGGGASVTLIPNASSSSRPLQALPTPSEYNHSGGGGHQLSFGPLSAASPPPMPSATRNPAFLDTTPTPVQNRGGGGGMMSMNNTHNNGGGGSSSPTPHRNNPTRTASPEDNDDNDDVRTGDSPPSLDNTDNGSTSVAMSRGGSSRSTTPHGQKMKRGGGAARHHPMQTIGDITPSTPPAVIVVGGGGGGRGGLGGNDSNTSMGTATGSEATPLMNRSQTASPLGPNASSSSSMRGGGGGPMQQNVSSDEEADQLMQRIKMVEKENLMLSANLQRVCEENTRITDQFEVAQKRLNACLASNPSAGLGPDDPNLPRDGEVEGSPSASDPNHTSLLSSIRDPEIVKGWFGGTAAKTKETFKDISIRIEQEFMAYRSTHASSNDEVMVLLDQVKRAHAEAAQLSSVIANTRAKGECAIIIKKQKDLATMEREENAKFEAQKARQLLELQITKLNAQIKEHEEDNDAINRSVIELQKRLSTSKDFATDLQRRLEEANERADASEAKTQQLQKEVVAQKLSVEQLKEEIAALGGDEENEEDEAAREEATAAAIQGAVAAVTADFAKFREKAEKEKAESAKREKKLRKELEHIEKDYEASKAQFQQSEKDHLRQVEGLNEQIHAHELAVEELQHELQKQQQQSAALLASAAAATASAEAVVGASPERKRREASSARHAEVEDELWAHAEAAESDIADLKEKLAASEQRCATLEEEVHSSRDVITEHQLQNSHLQQSMEEERRRYSVIEAKFIAAQEKMAKMDLLVMEAQEDAANSRATSPTASPRSKTPSRSTKNGSVDAIGGISASRLSDLQVQVDRNAEEKKQLIAQIQTLCAEAEAAAEREKALGDEINLQKRFLASANVALEEEKLKSQMLEAAVKAEMMGSASSSVSVGGGGMGRSAPSLTSGMDNASSPNNSNKKAMSRKKKGSSSGDDAVDGARKSGKKQHIDPFGNTANPLSMFQQNGGGGGDEDGDGNYSDAGSAVSNSNSTALAQLREQYEKKLKASEEQYLRDLLVKDGVITALNKKIIDVQTVMASMDAEKESTVSLARFSTMEVANESLKKELEERAAHIAVLEDDLNAVRTQLEHLADECEEKDAMLAANEEALKTAHDDLTAATKELDRRDAVIKKDAVDLKERLAKNSTDSAAMLAEARNKLEAKSAEAAKYAEENAKLRSDLAIASSAAAATNTTAAAADLTANAILKKDNAAKVREVNALQETIKQLREEVQALKAANAQLLAAAAARGGAGGSAAALASPPRGVVGAAASYTSPQRLTNPSCSADATATSSDLQQRYNDVLAAKVKSEYNSKRRIKQLEGANEGLEVLVKDLQTAVKRLEYDTIVLQQEKIALREASVASAAGGSKKAGSKKSSAVSAAAAAPPLPPALGDSTLSATIAPDQYFRLKCEVDKKNVEIRKLQQTIATQADDYRDLVKKLELKVRAQQDALLVAKLTSDPTNTLQLLNHNHPLVYATPPRGKHDDGSPISTVTFDDDSPMSLKRGAAAAAAATPKAAPRPLAGLAPSPSAEAIRTANAKLDADRDVLIRKVAELEDTIDVLVARLAAAGTDKGDGSDDDAADGHAKNAAISSVNVSVSEEPSSTAAAKKRSKKKSPSPSHSGGAAAAPSVVVVNPIFGVNAASSYLDVPSQSYGANGTAAASLSSAPAVGGGGAPLSLSPQLQAELEATRRENDTLLERINALEDQLSAENAANSALQQTIDAQKSVLERLTAENGVFKATAAAAAAMAPPPPPSAPHSRVMSGATADGEDGDGNEDNTTANTSKQPLKQQLQTTTKELKEVTKTNKRIANELLLAKSEISAFDIERKNLQSNAKRLEAQLAEANAKALRLEQQQQQQQQRAVGGSSIETVDGGGPLAVGGTSALGVGPSGSVGPAWLRNNTNSSVATSFPTSEPHTNSAARALGGADDEDEDAFDHADEDEDDEGGYGAFGARPPATTAAKKSKKKAAADAASTTAVAVAAATAAATAAEAKLAALQKDMAALKAHAAEQMEEQEDAHHNALQRLQQQLSQQDADYQEELEHLQLALNTAERSVAEGRQEIGDLKTQLAESVARVAELTAAAEAASATAAPAAAAAGTLARKPLGKKGKAAAGAGAASDAPSAASLVDGPLISAEELAAKDAKIEELTTALELRTKDLSKLNAAFAAYRAAIEADEDEEDEELEEDEEEEEEDAPAPPKAKPSATAVTAAHHHTHANATAATAALEAELARVVEELVTIKSKFVEYMAVTDRLGLQYPFSDPKLERCAMIRLESAMLLEAADNAKFYYFDPKKNKMMAPPPSVGGRAGGAPRATSAPAPQSVLRKEPSAAAPKAAPTAAAAKRPSAAAGAKAPASASPPATTKAKKATAAASATKPKPAAKSTAEDDALNKSASSSAIAGSTRGSTPLSATGGGTPAAKKKVTVVVPANAAASPKPPATAAAKASSAAVVGAGKKAATEAASVGGGDYSGSGATPHKAAAAGGGSERNALLTRRTPAAGAATAPAAAAATPAKPPASASSAAPLPPIVDDGSEMLNANGRPMTAWQRATALEKRQKEAAAAAAAAAGGGATAAAATATPKPKVATSSSATASQKKDSSAFAGPPPEEDEDFPMDDLSDDGAAAKKKKKAAAAEAPKKKLGLLERAAARFKREDDEYAAEEKRKANAKKKASRHGDSDDSDVDGWDDGNSEPESSGSDGEDALKIVSKAMSLHKEKSRPGSKY